MPLINQATVDTATTGKTQGKDAVWAKQTVTIGFHRHLNLKVIVTDALIDLCQLSVPDFLMNMEQKGLPAFETVRRSRQKVQATYPDLAATGVVGAFRARNEKVYREFAKSEV